MESNLNEQAVEYELQKASYYFSLIYLINSLDDESFIGSVFNFNEIESVIEKYLKILIPT